MKDSSTNNWQTPSSMARRRRNRRCILLAMLLLILVLSAIELYLSNYVPVVSSYCLSSEKLSAPIRVVFLSDLHGKEFGTANQDLLKLIAAQEPDLIAFGGDIINNDADAEEINAMCSLITRASKIAPVYYCLGNHEFNYNLRHDNELSDRIQEAGAILLDSCFIDATVNGNNIRLGGYMGYYRQPGMMGSTGEQWQRDMDFMDAFEASDQFTLLLNHIPTSWIDWNYRNRCDVDLVLCGHYHGGVIRIPLLDQGVYAPYIGWFPPYTKGMFEGEMATCILTTGLAGYGAIPRFFNRPEICVVDVVPT